MSQQLLPLDGFCLGPLFRPPVKRRPPVPHRGEERRAAMPVPPWFDRVAVRNIERQARELTLETGTQHSVDHIVPVRHPLVCGLHVQSNLCVLPLADNIRKSNNHWPQMWGEQGELI